MLEGRKHVLMKPSVGTSVLIIENCGVSIISAALGYVAFLDSKRKSPRRVMSENSLGSFFAVLSFSIHLKSHKIQFGSYTLGQSKNKCMSLLTSYSQTSSLFTPCVSYLFPHCSPVATFFAAGWLHEIPFYPSMLNPGLLMLKFNFVFQIDFFSSMPFIHKTLIIYF